MNDLQKKKKLLSLYKRYMLVDKYGNKRMFDDLDEFLKQFESMVQANHEVSVFVQIARYDNGRRVQE